MRLVRAHAQHSSCRHHQFFLEVQEGVGAEVVPGNNNTMVRMMVLTTAVAMQRPSLVAQGTKPRVPELCLVALERMHEMENGKFVTQNAKGLDLDCRQNHIAMDIVQAME
jgi:hypothetical protein